MAALHNSVHKDRTLSISNTIILYIQHTYIPSSILSLFWMLLLIPIVIALSCFIIVSSVVVPIIIIVVVVIVFVAIGEMLIVFRIIQNS